MFKVLFDMGTGLKITQDQVENKEVLRIKGRLDATSAPILEKKIMELLGKKPS